MTADPGVAIIGMGCRFPGGAEGLDRYWDLLDGATDAIAGVPSGRWAAGLPYYDGSSLVPGKTGGMSGGFLDDIAGWDAALFGVSPAEALRIDPQQRLIMEVTWRAIEDAGIGHGDLRAARTGIFAAVTDSQQFTRLEHQYDPPCVDDPFMAVGSSASMAAGRLAFLLDASGPAVSIDTACSTSLVAMHLAMESLLRGECDLAIVAAASAVIHPESFVAAHQIGMLAPDGHCKAFDRRADGFSIGEGAGAVLLERAADAAANRRRIRAVARGSAVNQNGRSDGITAPQRQAQADVIRRALARGAVAAQEVDFVEAHGAGTVLGDAIELEALADVFGPRDRDRALHIGAVKTNMGHLLVAAGMAGLIKTVLALEHRKIPPNVNFRAPNPILRRTPWMQPVASAVQLDTGPRPIAGVSSFGWSGTNAHVVLQAAPLRPATALTARGPHVLTLAAASARALGALAAELSVRLERQPDELADVARTLQEGRSWHPVRSAIICASAGQAAAACRTLAGQPPQRAGTEGKVRVGFSFPGACAAGPAVVAALAEGFGGFRAAAQECREAFLAAGLDPLEQDAAEFTIGYALAAVLRDGGIQPAGIYGAGYLGGCLARVFSLEHAARMVAASASGQLRQAVASGPLCRPAVPLVCAGSGTWLTPGAAQDPEYWTQLPGRRAPHGQAVETLAASAEVIAGACEAGALNGAAFPRQGERPVPVIPLLAGRADADPGDHTAALLTGVARIWETGAQVAWPRLTAPAGQIVSLPGHPFERRTFWPSAPAGAGVAAAADSVPGGRSLHCYTRIWQQPVTRARAAVSRPGTVVLFPAAGDPAVDPAGDIGDALAGRLRAAGWQVHLAPAGLSVPDRAAVLEQAAADGAGLTVIDCSGLGTDDAVTAFSGLMFTCQAISRSLTGRDVALVAAVSGAVEVVGGDAGSVAGGACTGLMSALSAEYTWLRCRVVDLDPATAAAGSLAGQVLAEMGQDAPLVAWRNGRRWVAGWARAEIPATPSPWRADGVYVITGGTRGLGMALAKHIALAGHPTLVLVGRTEFPPRSRWDAVVDGSAPAPDAVRDTIAGVAEIERRGAQVLVLSADVSDPAQMRSVLRSARERYGAVHGIVHCAGVPGSGLLDRKTATGAAAVISTKTGALTALSEAIQAGGLDFVVLYSSAVTALGGLGETDYAAANACLETFASASSASGTRVIAVSWGPWQHDDWQPAGLAGAPDLALAIRRYRLESGITADAGTALLDRLIGVIVPNVLVLTESLEDSRQRWAGLRDIDVMAAVPAADARRPRPDLLAPYIQPGTPLQRAIAGIWQQYLGLEQVGIDDPFFDLGGNSLTGVSMLRRLGRELGLALPPGLLFERPTVRELAAALGDDRRAGAGQHAPAADGSLRRQLRTEAIQARRRELLIKKDKREAKT